MLKITENETLLENRSNQNHIVYIRGGLVALVFEEVTFALSTWVCSREDNKSFCLNICLKLRMTNSIHNTGCTHTDMTVPALVTGLIRCHTAGECGLTKLKRSV